jgi:hypothetical protein
VRKTGRCFRGGRGERGGRRIGFSPRTPRLRVRLCISLIYGSALLLPSTSALSVFNGFHFPFSLPAAGERGQGTIFKFDSVGCQQLSLNSQARDRSGCGALYRVQSKGNWCIQNRKSFPHPVSGFFLTRSRGERGGRRIGFSPRTPRLRVRLCIPLIHGSALLLPSTSVLSIFNGKRD